MSAVIGRRVDDAPVIQPPTMLVDHAPFSNTKHWTHAYAVDYFDAVQGGCGLTNVPVAELHQWLNNRPGVLIRSLTPLWIPEHDAATPSDQE